MDCWKTAVAGLVPVGASPSSQLVSFLIRHVGRMEPAAASAWHTRLAEVYGDLGGQRAFKLDRDAQRYREGDARATDCDIIVGLQTYFALVCDALAIAHLQGELSLPSGHRAARKTLTEISSGRIFESLGVTPASNPLPFDWYVAHLSANEIALVRAIMATIISLAECLSGLPRYLDVTQWLHAQIMPRNLLHVLGEFYTPPWLAELLLEDVDWKPDQTLVDPYAGSGVFLLAALERAARLGCEPVAALAMLAGMDLNPVAYVACRTNLLLRTVDPARKNRPSLRLPIVCDDALLAEPVAAHADVLVTNPPWVGWEYMSRPYRERLNPLWKQHELYTARGRDAAFLKEDLSTLALITAWDRYLRPGGRSAVVVRPACMQSRLAGRGLRRLSIQPDSQPLALRLIRTFNGLRPFANTAVAAAAWVVEKGAARRFPIEVEEWRSTPVAWQPTPFSSLHEVRRHMEDVPLVAARSDPGDSGSPWTIGSSACHDATARLLGSNPCEVRTGVFTGGANGVYYLERLARRASSGCRWYRNVVERAKRSAPSAEMELEAALVYEVVRGRDLSLWQAKAGAEMLCPHTEKTRMRALPQEHLERRYPRILRYLASMRGVLDERRGFSGWERSMQEEAFYAIQRVGAYTFSPYKTAWKYIARDFIVAVIGPDGRGRPRLCNDKVMYVSFDDEQAAFYLCGVLSSDPVRWCVVSTMTGTQISTSAIRHLHISPFMPADATHRLIARACQRGHAAVAKGRSDVAEKQLATINRAVADMYGLTKADLEVIGTDLCRRFSARRFSARATQRRHPPLARRTQ
jgi:hypothetical protein